MQLLTCGFFIGYDIFYKMNYKTICYLMMISE